MNVRRRPPAFVVVTFLVLSAIGGAGAQALWSPSTVAIPGHGGLVLKVPLGWSLATRGDDGSASTQIRFGPKTGDAFSCQITAVWLDPPKLAKVTPARLRSTVEATAAGPLQASVEKKVDIRALKGARSSGYYFSLSDRAPQGNGYRYLTQGSALVGDVMVMYTFLHRDAPSPEKDRFLDMVASATRSR